MPAISRDTSSWTLHFPVVTDIMKLSSPTTIASIMRTCRLLNSEGPKHLLRDGVTLRTPGQITSFASFMFADPEAARFRRLRELSLEMGSLECRALVHDECSSAADALLELLRCPALCLHTLRLGRAEELLSSSHAIRVAFRALATLKHLTVCDVGSATVSTVGKMPSQLVSATICNSDPALDLVASSEQVIAMLAPFSDTLEEVSLVLDGPCNFAETPLRISFPHVRRLTILSDSCRYLPSCIHAFPNVEAIQHNPSATPQRSIACQSNINAFFGCVDAAARHWLSTDFRLSALTECSSDLLTLCVLRPALGALRKLSLSTQVHDLTALALVADVLTAAQPAELEMCVAGLDILEGVVSLLVERCLGTLCALRIDFSFAPGYQKRDDLAAVLVRLAAIVDGFPLELPSFDVFLDLVSCFGPGAAYLQDEDVSAFRDCLATSSATRVHRPAPCSRRIIPVIPVCGGEDEDLVDAGSNTRCELEEDEHDSVVDTRSDRSEWGYSDTSGEYESDCSEDEDDVKDVVCGNCMDTII